MKTLRNFIEYTMIDNSFLEITDGLYLWTQENIMEEQKTWDEKDKCKNFDFTTHEFWTTTDCGKSPDGYETVDEALVEYFR